MNEFRLIKDNIWTRISRSVEDQIIFDLDLETRILDRIRSGLYQWKLSDLPLSGQALCHISNEMWYNVRYYGNIN